MRAAQYQETGSTDAVEVGELERPQPGKNEILLEVGAASVNHLDALNCEGVDMFGPQSFPAVPGLDAAGTVAAIGEGVTEFAEGDRVCAAAIPGPLGSFAEYVVAPAANVGKLPESVSFAAGAGIGHAGIVAWRALVDHGNLEPRDNCLIHGGSGGVGHLAVQLANVHNATVLTTSSSAERRDRLEELGADAALDYGEKLRDGIETAAPAGVDVIVDAYLNQYLELDLTVLAKHGNIVGVEFAGTAGGTAEFSQFHTRLGNWKEANLQWVGVPNAPNVSHVLERLGGLIADGDLTVDVEATYDLSAAEQALHDIFNKEYVGKLIVEP